MMLNDNDISCYTCAHKHVCKFQDLYFMTANNLCQTLERSVSNAGYDLENMRDALGIQYQLMIMCKQFMKEED